MSNVSTTTAAIYQAVLDSLNSSGECGVLPPAPPGKSAYEVAVANGFVGSEKQWLDSLTLKQEQEIARLEARIVGAEKFTKDNKYAASRLVGKSSGQVPTIEGLNGVAGTGLAGHGITFGVVETNEELLQRLSENGSCFFRAPNNQGLMLPHAGAGIFSRNFSTYMGLSTSYSPSGKDIRIFAGDLSAGEPDYTKYQIYSIYSDKNTTLDGNGALKPSSPVLRVFSDRIEGNGDGDLMAATYTKNGVGDYTISGTTGLRTDGWYVVIPNDMNGNPKVAITLDDKDGVITLKTYVRIFDMTTFKFVPDLKQPLDIPEGRWIDLRFNDLPEEELYEPEEEPEVVEEVPVEVDPED